MTVKQLLSFDAHNSGNGVSRIRCQGGAAAVVI